MNAESIIKAMHYVGEYLKQLSDNERDELFLHAQNKNPWFTPENSALAFDHYLQWLDFDTLMQWAKPYLKGRPPMRTVGLVLAGNLPMVGFHDILAVICSGHRALIKASSQDEVFTKFFIDTALEIEPELGKHLELVDRLKDMDAVIATGSNNSSRYFDAYFGKYPHIIRRNRTSVAVLDGTETDAELKQLYGDIFSFFGLGCRNISKVYLPQGYEPTRLMQLDDPYVEQIHHHKYLNNYEYNKSIYLVNLVPHFDNGHYLLKEDENIHSPLAVVYYEFYEDVEDLSLKLAPKQEQIQCVVGRAESQAIPFGRAQFPTLTDYADKIDTMAFLSNL